MRMRVTVSSSADRRVDLKVASAAKAKLFVQAPIWEDPEYPLQGIHRDYERRCYFEFATDHPQQLRQLVAGLPSAARITVSENPPPPGEGCENCGNVSGPVLPSVCPNCDFRDIAPCPNPRCPRSEVPRREYIRLGANLGANVFRCPACNSRVCFRYNEPMFRSDGTFNPPLILVDAAEALATHEIR